MAESERRKPGRPKKGSEPVTTDDKEYAADYKRKVRAAGRDITIPEVVNPERRELCRYNLKLFCLTYFIERFPKPFSECHLELIRDLENTVLNGSMKAFALPRGSGKTTISVVAAIWAAVYGHQPFIVLLAATTDMSRDGLLNTVKMSLEHTDLLLEDFPHVCAPIRALEGENKRCTGQTIDGVHTLIQWKKERIILPKVPGSECSETIIHATGILGTVRGLLHLKSTGEIIRPSLVLIDDPQTDESAASPGQCTKRLNVITSGVMQMCGPGESIAAMMPCTVIKSGDMAHRVLDKEEHPDWRGTCVKMVDSWSDNHEVLWMQEYAEIRKVGLIAEDNGKTAGEFYAENRTEMDKGCSVYWKERCNEKKGELSAIQHAYNLLLKFKEPTFCAEYQNEPLDDFAEQEPLLKEKDIQDKAVEPVAIREVPIGYDTLVSFIDCGKGVLHYATCAIGDNFSGCFIDYGEYKFPKTSKRGGFEGCLSKALKELSKQILSREYRCLDGTYHNIQQLAVDAGAWTKTVYRFVRTSEFANIMQPYMGFSHESYRVPMKISKKKIADGWYIHPTKIKDAMLFHSNVDFFKSFLEERWRVPVGGRGSMTIYKKNHPEFCSHMVAETRKRTVATSSGEEYDKWTALIGRFNHLLDCAVGCCALGHFLGVRLSIEEQDEHKKGKEKKRVSFASMAKQGN